MSESVIEIRNRLRAQRGVVTGPPGRPSVEPATPAFALENAETGRMIVSTPIFESEAAGAITQDDFVLRLSGRLVEAERANRNGAFWTQGDLEFGLPSVAYGPLNWLHEGQKVVGTLLSPSLVAGREAAAVNLGPHIRTDAVVWGWLYPRETAMLRDYASSGRAWMSMECISQQVQCVGPGGCGSTVPYLDYQRKTEKACAHLRDRTAHRRFVNPIFQGAAVIVPPVAPGWANATLGVQTSLESERQAASLLEGDLHVPGVADEDAQAMVAQILQWSARNDEGGTL